MERQLPQGSLSCSANGISAICSKSIAVHGGSQFVVNAIQLPSTVRLMSELVMSVASMRARCRLHIRYASDTDQICAQQRTVAECPRRFNHCGRSSKPLPSRLTRDTQRGSNLRPTHLARSK
jgi:hypothetical protein